MHPTTGARLSARLLAPRCGPVLSDEYRQPTLRVAIWTVTQVRVQAELQMIVGVD